MPWSLAGCLGESFRNIAHIGPNSFKNPNMLPDKLENRKYCLCNISLFCCQAQLQL